MSLLYRYLIILLMCASIVSPVFGQETSHVLLLNSYHLGLNWTDDETQGVRDVLSKSERAIELHVEYMDTKRIADETHFNNIRQLLNHKYRNTKLAAVLVTDNDAFDFVRRYRHDNIFSDVPVIFAGVNFYTPKMLANQKGITGVAETFDGAQTVELMLRLHPDVNHIVVIIDGTITGLAIRRELEPMLAPYVNKVSIDYWDKLSLSQLRSRLPLLRKDTLVLLMPFAKDSLDTFISYPEMAKFVSSFSAVPIYSTYDFYLGYGIVGGRLTSGESQGRTAAEILLRILQGEDPDKIPVMPSALSEFKFDSRQLHRFGISANMLPLDSLILNQSWFELHYVGVWLAGLIFLLIVLLGWGLIRFYILKRRSDKALKQSKEQLETILNSTVDSIFQVGKNGIILAINNIAARRVHHKPKDMIGKNTYEFFPPEVSKCRRENIEEVFLTGIGKHSEDSRNDHHFSLNYYPIFNEENTVDSVVVYASDITQRKKESNLVRESEEKLRGLFELSALGIALTDMNGQYIEFNDAFQKICGYSKEELNKLDYWTLTPKKYAADEARQLELLNSTGRYGPYEKEYIRNDGTLIPIVLNGLLLTGIDGTKHIWSIVEDISERQKILAELRDSEERFRQMFERHSDVMLLIEPLSGVIVDANPAASKFYGYPLMYLIGKDISKINGKSFDQNQSDLERVLDPETHHFICQHKLANGNTRTVEVHASPVKFKNKNLIFSIVHDITDRQQADEEIRQLAFYDTLTNIPNRRLLYDRLDQTLNACKRNGCFGALMFLDLDNFKPINDKHGHEVGDLLLIEAARRISSCIRLTDTVARFGGDEFVVLLGELSYDKVKSESQARIIAEKIRSSISNQFQIKVQHEGDLEFCVEHRCTSSIGVVLFNHQDIRDDILKSADIAMYEAKGAGRNCVVFEDNNSKYIKS